MIYLDNASTSYVYDECLDIVNKDLQTFWGNPSNNYKFGNTPKEKIQLAKERIAETLNCLPEEIILTSGASESNAFICLQAKDMVYMPIYEHHSFTLNPKSKIVTDDFFLTASKKKTQLEGNVFEHMLVSNETGEIFKVAHLFEQAHDYGMMTAMDITQAYGNIPINIYEYGCDFASCSGHKFHAPKGCGFLFIKKDLLSKVKPLIPGTQQAGIRGGTENVALYEAMGYAAERVNQEMGLKKMISIDLRHTFLNILHNNKIDYVVNEGEENIPSTLNVALKGVESEIIQSLLSEQYIYIGVGSACNDGSMPLNQTLVAMGVSDDYIHGPIRLSFSVENTKEDVMEAAQALIDVYRSLVGGV